jgi:hypothetical protein
LQANRTSPSVDNNARACGAAWAPSVKVADTTAAATIANDLNFLSMAYPLSKCEIGLALRPRRADLYFT